MAWRACGLALSLVLLAGCSQKMGPPPIHVGHVAVLSGPGKEAGEQAARAIRLAVQEQVQQAGKEHDRPIFVHHTDTRGSLEAFEAEAARLVTVTHVVALLGGTTADEVARLDRAQVPIVTPVGLRARGLSELVFCTGLSPTLQGRVLAQFAGETFPPGKIAILADGRREEALGLAEAFAQALAKSSKDTTGGPVTWRFDKENPLEDLLKRAAESKHVAVLLAGSTRDLLKVRKEVGAKVPILFGGEEGSARALREAGMAGPVYLATAFVPDVDVPRARDFLAAYRKAYSEEPDVHAALAYDGARLLFEAIKQSQLDLGGTNIAKELTKLKDFPGLTGSLAFAADQRLRRPAFLVRVQQGEVKTMKRYPAED